MESSRNENAGCDHSDGALAHIPCVQHNKLCSRLDTGSRAVGTMFTTLISLHEALHLDDDPAVILNQLPRLRYKAGLAYNAVSTSLVQTCCPVPHASSFTMSQNGRALPRSLAIRFVYLGGVSKGDTAAGA